MTPTPFTLKARRLGIDTNKYLVVYLREGCSVCRSEGLRSEARIKVILGNRWVVATLNVVTSDILNTDEIGFSEGAWHKLEPQEGDEVMISHATSLDSFGYVRAKLYGKPLTQTAFKSIMKDMMTGLYSDIQLSSFVTACVDLSLKETIALTKAMSESGRQLKWSHHPIVDKHCVGGLPGNRTSMIVVPIIAAYGLTIPKTSSRSITSPSGTADTMETLAPVDLSMEAMKRVVEKEGGCIVWGGSVDLSPVDDIFVQVERALDLDSNIQLVASVLSKKIAAGSTNVLIDIPIGPTAKVRSQRAAHFLKSLFLNVGKTMDLNIQVVMTDGRQPVGRGIGPALEARDVLSVLRREKNAPQDLRDRGLFLASRLLEECCKLPPEQALMEVQKILYSGRALKKFESICEAQGGMREPRFATHQHVITSKHKGIIINIDNRHIARVAKFAGAPDSPVAGVDLHTPLGTSVEKREPLFTIHSDSPGELEYTLNYIRNEDEIIRIKD